ncbi:MAG: hypothetical protein M5U26_01965 [Planctomycetota bacterium]|nr:hypothetical protein [Planctomycetota bacterium]
MTLREKAVRHLARHVEEILDKQDEHGVFWPDAYFVPAHNTDYQQFAYYPLAWLYVLEHPQNPWRGNARLLKAVSRALRNNLKILRDDGEFQMSSHDQAPHWHANNWRGFSWLRTWELLRGRLEPALEAECEAGLRKAFRAIEATARQQAGSAGFAVNHNCANHPSWYLLAAYVLARAFAARDAEAWAAAQLERFCAAQHPAGVWYEHDGPATVYQHVTMNALSHYLALSGSPAARDALRRALGFYRLFTYPNAHPAETLDGRVRYTGYVMSIPPSVWAHLPEGRAYLHFQLDRLLEQPLGGGYQVHGGWLGLPFFTQFARDLPEDEPAPEGLAPLAGDGAYDLPKLPVRVIKRGPWTVIVSGFTRPEQPGVRWTLDYQTHLSVFHERAGLILGGGGGKRQAALSLFTGGSRPLGLPCLASRGSVEPAGPFAVRLKLAYDGFDAALEVAVEPDAVRLAACIERAETARGPGLAPFHLQLPFLLKGEGAVTTGSGMKYELDLQQEILAERLGERIGREGRFSISGLADARALLHFLPYNTHWRDGRYTPDKALGLVAQPLNPGQPRELVVRAEG